MTDSPTMPPLPLVKYDPNEAAIAKLKGEVAHLLADPKAAVSTKKGYEECKIAIAVTRNWRGILEKKRVELKADALAFGKKVDAEAKRVLEQIMEIEGPIKAAKEEADTAKEREEEAKLAAEKAKIEAEEKAKRDAEEARLKAIRDEEERKLKEERAAIEAERKQMAEAKAAEDARRKAEDNARDAEKAKADAIIKAEQDRIAAEQKAEADRLAADRKAIEGEKARIAKIETDRLAKEKAEKEAAERAEFERAAREKAEAAAKAKAEADLIAAEKAAKEKAEAAQVEAVRIADAAPDQEKIRNFGEDLDQWTTRHTFQLKTEAAKAVIADAYERLNALSVELCNYSTPKKAGKTNGKG